jgi:hypothetical protein
MRPESPRDGSLDGPLEELSSLIDELKVDETKLGEFCRRELEDLLRKPDLNFLDELDTRNLLDQVEPLLLSRLNGASQGNARI